MNDSKRNVLTGRAVPVRGNDIDTDRIIPARYLRTTVFEGLGEHAFEDDRSQLREAGHLHPFDDPRFAGASALIVNKNFGCGSSREHAPQAIMRWGSGIRMILGESFAEIFYGNCIALGVPCAVLDAETIDKLMQCVEANPEAELRLRLEDKRLECGDVHMPIEMPEGARRSFIEGTWDSTIELLAAAESIRATASKLPYFSGLFRAGA
jgi:3-isopropylmalate/(R)-2-methylmalate dehydratase small subunit